MKYGGELTAKDASGPFAVCWKCQLVYRDKVLLMGSVICPNCDLAVQRGIDRDRAQSLMGSDGYAGDNTMFELGLDCAIVACEQLAAAEADLAGEQDDVPLLWNHDATKTTTPEEMADVSPELERAAAEADLAGDGGLESVDPVVFDKIGGL